MKHNVVHALLMLNFILFLAACGAKQVNKEELIGLSKTYEGKFKIGTALNARQIVGKDSAALEVVEKYFNSIVAENIMKSAMIQPNEGDFKFDLADQFVAFGEKNDMNIHGHALIWHSQIGRWFFVDSLGNEVSKELLIQRMQDHIYTVVGRYKGRVHSWDVVNEAILDDGSYRNSRFYKILGKDFIKLAFQFAHDADPDAKLYYNDYSMALPLKRDGVVAMVKELQNQGIQIDGIGMQGHVGLDNPSLEDFENSIIAFGNLGVEVMITEMDVSVIPSPFDNTEADVALNFDYRPSMDPYKSGLPDSVNIALTKRYESFFKLFLKHDDVISRVTLWGVNDANSWKNNWPIGGRTDYPLLFDRNNQPKSAVDAIIGLVE
jgi:endo-1,4-beta-xylanase